MKHHITEILWMRCLSMDSQFCEAVVSCGYLTCDRRTEATEDRPRGLYYRILSVMCRQTRGILSYFLDKKNIRTKE